MYCYVFRYLSMLPKCLRRSAVAAAAVAVAAIFYAVKCFESLAIYL